MGQQLKLREDKFIHRLAAWALIKCVIVLLYMHVLYLSRALGSHVGAGIWNNLQEVLRSTRPPSQN